MVAKRTRLIDRALTAKRESRGIEFKAELDLAEKRSSCEFVKDVLALVNSGGGVILVGVRNDGSPSGFSVSGLLETDPAILTNMINAYTGQHYSEFEIREHRKGGQRIASLELAGVPVPLVPIRPGTFEDKPGKQRSAFSAGVVYVRHGAKSEPATTRDLEAVIERRLREIRKGWLGGLRKVVTAPVDSVITVASTNVRLTDGPSATEVRLTDRADAPEFQLIDPDKTHPFRMNDFLKVLNRELAELDAKATAYDIRAILRVFRLERDLRYTHKPRYGPRQYSRALVSWIVAKARGDGLFFIRTKSKYRGEKRRATAGA